MRGNGSKMQAYRRADDRVEITTDSGERVWAAAPVIVSASRATDIPACYTEWFFRRLQRGYAVRRNPFNNTRVPVSFARTRVVVFWSKNPRPLLPRLGELEEREIHSLLHYTLNDYVAEGFEPNLPPLDERIDTSIRISFTLRPETLEETLKIIETLTHLRCRQIDKHYVIIHK